MWTLSIVLMALSAAPDAPTTPPGRVSLVAGQLLVRGPHDTSNALVTVNAVIRPGDQLRTPYGTFAEVELVAGTFLHMAGGTNVVLDEVDGLLLVVVEKGAVSVKRGPGSKAVSVIALGGRVALDQGARCRVTVDRDDLRVEVRLTDGYADLVTDAASERLRPGETVAYLPGAKERGEWTEDHDAFDEWVETRCEWLSQRRPPHDLPANAMGAADLSGHGEWITVVWGSTTERVWRPRVSSHWRPYLNGSWSWTEPWGWVWVPSTSWEYITHHYGGWRHDVAHGWVWIPGPTWRPAHVSWVVVGPYVGWVPWGHHHTVDPDLWVFADLVYFWSGGGCFPGHRPGQILDSRVVARHRTTRVSTPRVELAPRRSPHVETLLAQRIRGLPERARARRLPHGTVYNPPRRSPRRGAPVHLTGRSDHERTERDRGERRLREREGQQQPRSVRMPATASAPRVPTIVRRSRPRSAPQPTATSPRPRPAEPPARTTTVSTPRTALATPPARMATATPSPRAAASSAPPPRRALADRVRAAAKPTRHGSVPTASEPPASQRRRAREPAATSVPRVAKPPPARPNRASDTPPQRTTTPSRPVVHNTTPRPSPPLSPPPTSSRTRSVSKPASPPRAKPSPPARPNKSARSRQRKK